MNGCCNNQYLTHRDGNVVCEKCGRVFDGTTYYKIIGGLNMDIIRSVFGHELDYEMNWLILSTSGVHGTYTSLDNLESDPSQWDEDGYAMITAMIFQPRIIRVIFNGDLKITRDDIPYMREVCKKTLEGMNLVMSENI